MVVDSRMGVDSTADKAANLNTVADTGLPGKTLTPEMLQDIRFAGALGIMHTVTSSDQPSAMDYVVRSESFPSFTDAILALGKTSGVSRTPEAKVSKATKLFEALRSDLPEGNENMAAGKLWMSYMDVPENKTGIITVVGDKSDAALAALHVNKQFKALYTALAEISTSERNSLPPGARKALERLLDIPLQIGNNYPVGLGTFIDNGGEISPLMRVEEK